MPLTLPSLSRRRFLSASIAAGLSAIAPRISPAANANLDRFILLSDTHIHADKSYKHDKMGTVPWQTLRQAVADILSMAPGGSAALVCGDCAAAKGLPADYANLIEGVEPLRKAGIPIHLALGNHDDRENFWRAMPPRDAQRNALPGRHVALISTPRANWLLLDSLDVTNKTPGVLGESQLAWLARTLDANATKPASVMVHHDAEDKSKPGLTDTPALLKVLYPRKQAKALVFGHTHVWRHSEKNGLHFINLPTTAWPFGAKDATGWTEATLTDAGATFKLHGLDHSHPRHGETLNLAWR